MCAWSAAASPDARRLCTWPNAACAWCCLKASALAGALRAAAAPRRCLESRPASPNSNGSSVQATRAPCGMCRCRGSHSCASSSPATASTATGRTGTCSRRSRRGTSGSCVRKRASSTTSTATPACATSRARSCGRCSRPSATWARSTTATVAICTRSITPSDSPPRRKARACRFSRLRGRCATPLRAALRCASAPRTARYVPGNWCCAATSTWGRRRPSSPRKSWRSQPTSSRPSPWGRSAHGNSSPTTPRSPI